MRERGLPGVGAAARLIATAQGKAAPVSRDGLT